MGRSNQDVGRSNQGRSNLGALKPQFEILNLILVVQAALVNSQLVCLRPVGILNSCCSVPSFRCVSLALKSPYGERSDHSLNLILVVQAALVNSQLVCLRPVGILNSFCSVPSFRCVSLALKSPYGERSIKYVSYCIVLFI